MTVQYRDPIIADMRQDMLIKDVLKQYPNIHLVDKLPTITPPVSLAVGWLHENMVQFGRAAAALAVGTWHCASVNEGTVTGNLLIHNYMGEMDARLVRRWRYPITYKDKTTEYLGWNVHYVKGGDLTRLEQHPMIGTMHNVAANNRKYPARWGDSRVMSWQATPKYAVIAAALAGRDVFVEYAANWDWKAVATKGFQGELKVMSGEWNAEQDARPVTDFDALAHVF